MLPTRVLKQNIADKLECFRVNASFKPKRRNDGEVLTAPRQVPTYRLGFDGSVLATHRQLVRKSQANIQRHQNGRHVWCPFARRLIAMAAADE